MREIRIQPIDASSSELARLFADPYISQVGHDDRPAAPIDHPAVQYYGAWLENSFMGAFVRIESGFVEIDVHSMLLKKAHRFCRDIGREFLRLMFENQAVHRITAQIIDGFSSAVNYCLNLGFVREGYRRDACRKDGQLVGVHILGLTRKDWGTA